MSTDSEADRGRDTSAVFYFLVGRTRTKIKIIYYKEQTVNIDKHKNTVLHNVEVADVVSEGWRLWLQFERVCNIAGTDKFPSDYEALEADAGKNIALIRAVGRRRG